MGSWCNDVCSYFCVKCLLLFAICSLANVFVCILAYLPHALLIWQPWKHFQGFLSHSAWNIEPQYTSCLAELPVDTRSRKYWHLGTSVWNCAKLIHCDWWSVIRYKTFFSIKLPSTTGFFSGTIFHYYLVSEISRISSMKGDICENFDNCVQIFFYVIFIISSYFCVIQKLLLCPQRCGQTDILLISCRTQISELKLFNFPTLTRSSYILCSDKPDLSKHIPGIKLIYAVSKSSLYRVHITEFFVIRAVSRHSIVNYTPIFIIHHTKFSERIKFFCR